MRARHKITDRILRQKSANIERALRFIEENLENHLTLEEVARESGISKYYFSRVFKASTGQSFKKLITEKRIKLAKNLLAEKEANITEICFSVGVNDLAYFDRVFRQSEGMTPSDYRGKFQK